MRTYGYIKLSSYFYVLYLIIDFIIDNNTNPLTNWIVFYISSITFYFIMQIFLYKPTEIKVKSYAELSFISIKDIFGITVAFLILNLVILGSIQTLSYILSGNGTIDFKSFGNLITSMLLFIVSLFISNFLYYKFYYVKKQLLTNEVEELKSNYKSNDIVMSVSKNDSEQENNRT